MRRGIASAASLVMSKRVGVDLSRVVRSRREGVYTRVEVVEELGALVGNEGRA